MADSTSNIAILVSRCAVTDSHLLKKLNLLVLFTTNLHSYEKKMVEGDYEGQIVYPRRVSDMAYLDLLRTNGEYIKKLPQAIKDQHPEIPWKELAKLRDAAAHPELDDNFKHVLDYIAQQAKSPGQIENYRTIIAKIKLDSAASQEEQTALEGIQQSMNVWAAMNAHHLGRKEEFLASLGDEEKPAIDNMLGNLAQIEFHLANKMCRLAAGNISENLSPFFHALVSDESGYASLPVTFKLIRNNIAHNDYNAKSEHISYRDIFEWTQKNGTPAALGQRYFNHVIEGLSEEKLKILDDTITKTPKHKSIGEHSQKAGLVMALADIGRDIQTDTLRKIANVVKPLATAKCKDISHNNPQITKNTTLEPFLKQICERMKQYLGLPSLGNSIV